jgi:dipeptidyl aminopeptidase/acylaminoacyl peptidase
MVRELQSLCPSSIKVPPEEIEAIDPRAAGVSLWANQVCARVVIYLLLVITSMACSDDSPVSPPLPTYKAPVDGYPAWSPDGAFIAYRRFVFSVQGPPGIYIVKSDGTHNRLLLDESPFYEQGFVLLQEIRFSPDGRYISITRDLEIYLLDVTSGDTRKLTNTSRNAAHPDWSPDGQRIVYQRAFFRSTELDSSGFYIIDVDSGRERALFNDGERVSGRDLRWSRKGEPIAFAATTLGGYPDIYTLRSDGTAFARLTDGQGRSFAEIPCWIDDGARILFAWRALGQATGTETHVIDSDGSNQAAWPLTLEPLTLVSDAISPNSQEVVVPALPQDSTDSLAVLFVRDLDDVHGLSMRQLTHWPESPDTSASSSPPPQVGRRSQRQLSVLKTP